MESVISCSPRRKRLLYGPLLEERESGPARPAPHECGGTAAAAAVHVQISVALFFDGLEIDILSVRFRRL